MTMHIRKTERAVTDPSEMIDILDRCEAVRIAFNDSPFRLAR
jgi:nitroimidazol reductase NimA-like FMN-containing flavoprotein (pyridoxamine 5'-phosphate oxidase superfamily)